MGVSKNRGTPKWMVYTGKPYQNGWFGGTTIFGYIQIYLSSLTSRPSTPTSPGPGGSKSWHRHPWASEKIRSAPFGMGWSKHVYSFQVIFFRRYIYPKHIGWDIFLLFFGVTKGTKNTLVDTSIYPKNTCVALPGVVRPKNLADQASPKLRDRSEAKRKKKHPQGGNFHREIWGIPPQIGGYNQWLLSWWLNRQTQPILKARQIGSFPQGV